MAENFLAKLFEHNNWANLQIVEACLALDDDQLDAEPQTATKGSIRLTLTHLVASQQNYLALLTQPVEDRTRARPAFKELQQSVTASGEGLLSLARGDTQPFTETHLETTDGYYVEPWVIMVQAINHATEHREQIKSMLTALEITPPDIDGWDYGQATEALVLIEAE